jgi:hypothetical protein
VTPVGSAVTKCPLPTKQKVHWLEIELVGDDGQPIPWEEYKVILPDGAPAGGYLDENGFARLENIENPGTCRISFPKLDKDAWDEVPVSGEARTVPE